MRQQSVVDNELDLLKEGIFLPLKPAVSDNFGGCFKNIKDRVINQGDILIAMEQNYIC